MRPRGQSKRTITVATAALVVAASHAGAQETPPGIDMTLDVGLGASVDDNEGLNDPSLGTTTEVFTSLDFRIRNETASDRLDFGIGTLLQFSDTPADGSETEILPPVASLSYSRFNRDSRFDFSGTYSQRPVDDTVLTFFDADLNPIDFVIDSGDLTRTTASIRYATGLESPLGFSGGVRVDNRDYSSTIDPDLYDRSTLTADVQADLVFSDVAAGRVFANYSMFDADDVPSTERTTTRVGVGATLAVSPVLEVDASVTYTSIEEEEFNLTTEDTDGFGWALSGTRALPDGELTAGIERAISTSSDRTLVSVSRSTETRAGDLSYGIGYSMSDDGDDVLLASFGISRDLADGRLGISLSQTTRSNDDDDDILFTRLGVDFRRSINEVSGYIVGFGLGRSEDIGGGTAETTTRADLNLSYRRELTEDWDWSLGYSSRYLDDDDGTARSNVFFTRIDRSFSIRP